MTEPINEYSIKTHECTFLSNSSKVHIYSLLFNILKSALCNFILFQEQYRNVHQLVDNYIESNQLYVNI